MPELPDITVYQDALCARLVGRALNRVQVSSPFLLRSVDPSLDEITGKEIRSIGRIGKRLVFGFEDDLHLVLHLMVAGRLHWKKPDARVSRKLSLMVMSFSHGQLTLTESSKKKRASLHLVKGAQGLAVFERGGLEVLPAAPEAFLEVLQRENHTLKRSLTDPRLFSGIGNAYSDEILHRARLSPLKQTSKLNREESERLHEATVKTLRVWIARLREQVGDRFPEKVTAFHPEMAVHGRYGQPCPVCAAPVQRIVYAENETNYCPGCQTGGKILADRALSRLLKNDWPRSLDQLEDPGLARD